MEDSNVGTVPKSSAAPKTAKEQQKAVRRVALASLVGTSIEWYDYFVYGLAAALIFNQQFFPNLDPVAGLLASLATFGVAFVARPFGGVVFGHFGDRIGRKSMLVLSLLLMGISTVAIGLLPNYDTIGVWAPILLVLMRVVQGFAVGGEWSGAVLMASEHAPKEKRAFYSSWPQAGVPVGLVLATAALYLAQLLPGNAFEEWAWRIPFIISALLVAIGLWIRVQVSESPEFAEVKENGEEAKVPLLEVMRTAKKPLVLGIAALFAANIPFYLATVFMLTYIPSHTNVDRGTVLIIICIVSVVEALLIPQIAAFADRTSRSRTLIIGAVLSMALTFPVFWMIHNLGVWGVIIGMTLILPVAHTLSYAAVGSYISDLFAPNVRFTGSALAYQIGGVLTSAPAPFVATWLLEMGGSWWLVAAYVVVSAAITLISLVVSRGDKQMHRAEEQASMQDKADALVS